MVSGPERSNLCDAQLSSEDFHAYKSRQAPTPTSWCSPHTLTKLFVAGYDAEASAAIHSCCGHDAIQVNWKTSDSAVSLVFYLLVRLTLTVNAYA